jgi:hypothetical protein
MIWIFDELVDSSILTPIEARKGLILKVFY